MHVRCEGGEGNGQVRRGVAAATGEMPRWKGATLERCCEKASLQEGDGPGNEAAAGLFRELRMHELFPCCVFARSPFCNHRRSKRMLPQHGGSHACALNSNASK